MENKHYEKTPETVCDGHGSCLQNHPLFSDIGIRLRESCGDIAPVLVAPYSQYPAIPNPFACILSRVNGIWRTWIVQERATLCASKQLFHPDYEAASSAHEINIDLVREANRQSKLPWSKNHDS